MGLKVGDVMERTKWWDEGDVMERTKLGLNFSDVMERTKWWDEGWRRNGKSKVWG